MHEAQLAVSQYTEHRLRPRTSRSVRLPITHRHKILKELVDEATESHHPHSEQNLILSPSLTSSKLPPLGRTQLEHVQQGSHLQTLPAHQRAAQRRGRRDGALRIHDITQFDPSDAWTLSATSQLEASPSCKTDAACLKSDSQAPTSAPLLLAS
jgi:hypothetical protein